MGWTRLLSPTRNHDGPLVNDDDGGERVIHLYLLQKYPFAGRVLLSRRLADCPGLLLLPFPLLFPRVLPGPGEGNGPRPSTPVNCVCGCRIWRRIAGVVIFVDSVAGEEVQIQSTQHPQSAVAQYPYNLPFARGRLGKS